MKNGNPMPRYSVTICLQIIALVFTGATAFDPAYAADSYVTRRPVQGAHFRRAGPEDIIPEGPLCNVYVAAYSHIFLFESGKIPLAINLSIGNTDLTKPLFIKRIGYYSADGTLIESVLSNNWILAPMATANYIIDQHDSRGGSGDNFVVQYTSHGDTSAPLIESVMAGYRGSKGLAFSSRGIAAGGCDAKHR
jgi:hypothetical protein